MVFIHKRIGEVVPTPPLSFPITARGTTPSRKT